MRYLTFIAIFILILTYPLFGEKQVYNVGNLEVSAEDLSTMNIKGNNKKIDSFEINEDRKKISRKLLNLGDSPIIIKSQKDSIAEITASIGTYTTVNVDALIANFDSNLLDFHYKSSDGYRFKTDFIKTLFKFQTLNNEYGGFKGDFNAIAHYKRENMPGSEGFETNFLERKVLGAKVSGHFTNKEFSNQDLNFNIDVSNLKGNSKNLAIDDDCDLRDFELTYEFRPENYKDIIIGSNLFTTGMSLDGEDDKSFSDFSIFVKGEKEFGSKSLINMNIGLKKISTKNIEPELDITIRKKIRDDSNIKLSLGRSNKLFSFHEILDSDLGYINLRSTGNKNIFDFKDYPIKISNYIKATYYKNFSKSDLTLYMRLEDVENDLSYISRNNLDSTLDFSPTGDDTKIGGVGFTYTVNINNRYKLSFNGEKFSYKANGVKIPFKPEGKLKMKLNYIQGNNRAYFDISGIDSHYDNYKGNKMGGFTTCDMGYTKNISGDISLSIDMKNIFNRRYYKKKGMVEMGRLTSAGIKYRF